MPYKKLVENGINTAFNKLGDLLLDLEFSKKQNSSFNFSSGLVNPSATITTKIKGVLVEKTRRGVLVQSFLVKASDLPEPKNYDSITDSNSRVWKIVEPSSTNGFTTSITVTGG